MKYVVTTLHTIHHTTEAGKQSRSFEVVRDWTIEAESKKQAAEEAHKRLTVAEDSFRIFPDWTTEPLEAAQAVAHCVLTEVYARQCMPFVLESLRSIERNYPDETAQDVIMAAAMAMTEAAKAGMCNYMIFRAGTKAANAYIRAERSVVASTLEKDFSDIMSGKLVYDCYDQADVMNHAAARDTLITAKAVCTSKQWRAIRLAARGMSMQQIADEMGLKNKSTACRHIQAGRAAIAAALAMK